MQLYGLSGLAFLSLASLSAETLLTYIRQVDLQKVVRRSFEVPRVYYLSPFNAIDLRLWEL